MKVHKDEKLTSDGYGVPLRDAPDLHTSISGSELLSGLMIKYRLSETLDLAAVRDGGLRL